LHGEIGVCVKLRDVVEIVKLSFGQATPQKGRELKFNQLHAIIYS